MVKPSDQRMTSGLQTIYTIGVYGCSEDDFFGALVDHNIELFLDVRARRGLRGSRYKFANSKYLQAKLAQLGIAYAHLPELAPTPAIRAMQDQADQTNKTAKRKRTLLSDNFVKAYRRDVLRVYKRKSVNKLHAAEVMQRARESAGYPADKPLLRLALFCVEREPAACHRSLLADELGRQLSLDIKHI